MPLPVAARDDGLPSLDRIDQSLGAAAPVRSDADRMAHVG
jgi:hypothetical protein